MMKKFLLCLVACAAAMTLAAQQYNMRIERTDGNTMEMPVASIESVTFVEVADTAVDLGLSVKWASFNIGATAPTERGFYFAWGETTPKNVFYRKNYAHLNETNDMLDIGHEISGTQYDAARAQWGSRWRMPTREECNELREKCDWQWTKIGNVGGMTVTSRTNGNSIFLPTTGSCNGTSEREPGYTTDNPLSLDALAQYRSGTMPESQDGKGRFVYCLKFVSANWNYATINQCYREEGSPIRPVAVY